MATKLQPLVCSSVEPVPSFTFAFDTGHPLPKMAGAVLRVLGQRRSAADCSHRAAGSGFPVK
jgi:hypothetical protein